MLMFRLFVLLAVMVIPAFALAEAPALVVLISVDQLRGDMPQTYRDRFVEGGFNRFFNDGVVYPNAHFGHTTTFTASGHATLATGSNPREHGLIGNNWYRVRGGMQDWMYRYTGNAEVTIELSDSKEPPAFAIAQHWADNEESLLVYMESIHRGVRGVVTDSVTGAPLFARVTVSGNTQPVFSDPDVGDYYRLLLAGTYTLTFEAAGHRNRVISNVSVGGGAATRLDITLDTPLVADARDVRDDFESLDANGNNTLTFSESGLSQNKFNNVDTNNDDVLTMVELLKTTFGASKVGVMNTVYVEVAYSGDEDGTADKPFNSIREGVGFVAPGGSVQVSSGTYSESLILNTSATLALDGSGSVMIDPTP